MANSKIKGITIEIGGDTSKLGKALDSSEKKTRSLQGELRQVERLLKFDPSNTELLAQKQKILSESVESTSEKLRTLKEAEAQVIAQFERGEIAEDQLRAFQREIIKTERELGEMKDELTTTENALNGIGDGTQDARQETKSYEEQLKEAQDTLSDFGDKAEEAYDKVKTGALAIGTATVAGAGYALKTTTEFDQALNQLASRTGATKEEMDALDESMQSVYKNNFGESIEDVANSMATVKLNTKASGEELEKLTERALLLRDTFDFDVNESTRSAKMLMDQFGISGEEAYNLIAQGAQAGLDKNGDLLDTINEYAVHYEQLGYSSEEFFNSLINGSASGTFSVDKLGDAMKEFGIRTKDTANTTTEGFELLGLDADKMREAFAKGGDSAQSATKKTLDALFSMDDQVKQNQAGVDLFGTMWEDLGIEGVKALMDVTGEVSTTSDALDQLNEQKYDDIGSALQGLGRTLETDVIKPIGDDLKPVVEDAISYVQENGPQIKEIVSALVKKVGEFVGFIVNNGSTILSVIAGIATGMMAWNVASMISGVVTAIKAFKTANEGATVAQAILNGVMLANPMILIATLIAAVVGAIITFIATNEDARKKLAEVWEIIKSTVGNVVQGLVDFFTVTIPNAFNSFKEKVVEIFTSVVEFIKTNWKALLMLLNPATMIAGIFKLVYDNCEGFRNFVNNFVENIKQFFINAWNNIVSFFTESIPAFFASVVSFFASLPEKIGYAIGFVIGTLAKWGVNVTNWIKTNVPKMISSIVNFFKQLPGKIWTTLVNVVTNIAKWGVNMLNKAKSVTTKTISTVVSFFKQLPGKIWDAIIGAVTKIATWGSKMLSKAKSTTSSVISNVVNLFKSLPGKISSAISGAISGIAKWGSQMLSKAKSAVSKVAKGIVSGFKNVPKEMTKIGKNIVEGLWKGMKNMGSWVKEKVKGFGKGLVDGAKSALGIHSPSKVFEKEVGENIALGVIKGIDNKKANAKKSAKELSELYVKSAKEKVKSLKESNKLSEANEVAFWEKIVKNTKKGTKAYKDATTELNKAKATLKKDVAKLDSDYKADVKAVKDQLKKDIQEVTDACNQAVESRQNSITSSLNLFDKFESKEATSKNDLLTNLKSQVNALRDWDNTLDKISKRNGVASSGLLEELEGMGVDSLGTLKELNSMSDKELAEYIKLYKQKNAIALERAETENEALKAQSAKEIKSLVETANKQLNSLETEYNKSLKKLGVKAKDQSTSIGKDIVKGLKSGINSQNKDFQKYLSKFFNSITNNAKNALQIHSPSRIFADMIGANIPSGIAKGIGENAKVATDAVGNLADSLVDNAGLFNGSTLSSQLNNTFGKTNIGGSVSDLVDLVSEYMPKLVEASKKSIVLDSGTLVGETINQIDAKLANNYNLRARGV